MKVFILLLFPISGVLLFMGYVSLLKRIIDQNYTKDMTLICAVLTFIFLFLLMFGVMTLHG